MVYIYKFKPTQRNLSVIEQKLKVLEKNSKRIKKELATPSREMQMVPMHLELATLKGRERFNSDEITEITELVKKNGSAIPADDLVKQLLNIGVKEDKPLSVKEIKDFLSATVDLDKKEQLRVLKFMQALKEADPTDGVIEDFNKFISENNTFENFKQRIMNGKDSVLKTMPDDQLREYYYNILERETNYVHYKAYTGQLSANPLDTSKFINLNNQHFVYGIAECEKPEILAKIAVKTGAIPEVAEASNELVKIYELSGGNVGLPLDLARGFYPEEIKQIATKLGKRKNLKDLSKYYPTVQNPNEKTTYLSGLDLADKRIEILKGLGLAKEIDLLPLPAFAFPKKVFRGFEQGKRR